MDLGQLFANYSAHLDSPESTVKSENYKAIVRSRLRQLLKFFGEKTPLVSIEQENLQAYINDRIDRVARKTVRNEIETFVTVRNWYLNTKLTRGLQYELPKEKLKSGKERVSGPYAKVIPRIKKLRAQGATLPEVADDLNAQGIPTTSGEPWTGSYVRSILFKTSRGIPLEE